MNKKRKGESRLIYIQIKEKGRRKRGEEKGESINKRKGGEQINLYKNKRKGGE